MQKPFRPSGSFVARTALQKTCHNSVHTRCIVKTSGFTRCVCKNQGDFIKFKGFLVEFLESRRSWENQKTPENRQKSRLF